MSLHPDLEVLGFLLGRWLGEGTSDYATQDPVEYGEEIEFTSYGKPVLRYVQRTWASDDRRPLHAEVGYLRPQPDGAVELVVAHPNGVAEIAAGRLEGTRLELTSTKVTRTPSAKEVTALTRSIAVDGDTLRYELSMAAVGQPMSVHLRAELKRQ